MESLDFAYTHTELDAEQRADGPDVHRAAVVQQPQDHFRRAVPREDWRVLSKFVRSISEILLGLIRKYENANFAAQLRWRHISQTSLPMPSVGVF